MPNAAKAAPPRRRGRLARLVAARLDRESYLGWHLTLGLALALLAAWAFGALLEEVLDDAGLVRWDVATVARLHAAATPAGLRAFWVVTQLGSPAAMAGLALAGALVLWRAGRRLLLLTWLAAFAGCGVLDAGLKALVHRTRPAYAAAYLHGHSYSFPSGHAMGSAVGYGTLAFAVHHWGRGGGARRWLPYVLAALAALLVGASRLYLGVHFPSDVLGGYAAGLAWLAVCATGYAVARGRASRRGPDPSA